MTGIRQMGHLTTETVLYEEMRPETFRARLAAAPIAYLPLGTLEWHGEHLPLGSDGLQSQGFFLELAQRVGGIVLPMLFLGPDKAETHSGREYYGMDLYDMSYGYGKTMGAQSTQLDGSAYWVSYELFEQILKAVLKQLKRAGFAIVVAHGHGPSRGVIHDCGKALGKEFGLEVFHCYREKEDGLGIQTDHAAANETSLVMALRPELVKMDNLSSNPAEFPIGVAGEDPRNHASAAAGRRAIDMQLDRMQRVLTEALGRVRASK